MSNMFGWSGQGTGTIYFFFFNDTATTEIYTLSLHDALPICAQFASLLGVRDPVMASMRARLERRLGFEWKQMDVPRLDRKSTRLNSSHSQISYAVFCLKKKKDTIGSAHSTYCRAGSHSVCRY